MESDEKRIIIVKIEQYGTKQKPIRTWIRYPGGFLKTQRSTSVHVYEAHDEIPLHSM
jgi:hypothetical protein